MGLPEPMETAGTRRLLVEAGPRRGRRWPGELDGGRPRSDEAAAGHGSKREAATVQVRRHARRAAAAGRNGGGRTRQGLSMTGAEEVDEWRRWVLGGGRRACSGKEGKADRRRRRPTPKETLGGAADVEKREV